MIECYNYSLSKRLFGLKEKNYLWDNYIIKITTNILEKFGDKILQNMAIIFFFEVEKHSFIVLPGKGGQSGLLPQKLCCPT